VNNLQVVKRALERFLINLAFCIILMLSLYFLDFLPTLWILTGIFILLVIFTKVVHLKPLETVLLRFERQYEKGFSGKETLAILLGYIFFLIILWILQYFAVFPLVTVALMGLVPLAFGHNLIKPVQALFRNHLHFINAKISVEGFVIAVLVNILVFYLLFPYAVIIFVYLSLIAALFDLLPHIDSNYTIPLFTSIAFLLFFI